MRSSIPSSIGLLLLLGAAGCSTEQGASVAPPPPGAAAAESDTEKANGKAKSAFQKPSVNVSPVQ